MMNLFNLSARLSLSTEDYDRAMNNAVNDAEKKGNGLGGKLKSIAGTTAKVFTGMAAATSAAVGFLVKNSIENYAEYEQLVGGVETLFKDSSNKVMEYAENAYKTAGMSANEYMSTITGFSASLLQGLGGDTAKAAEIGNLAVTDMSDNANKMGTSMEMIQNAYQGFAKQNYTMLDNLKLGYGGTKEEMQRLLADAEKLSGQKYDIGNFSDVIEAIHVVQDEMGITGTTAKEASSTIEGSLNMTKSAWENLMTGLADSNADFDGLINNLVDSASAFGENILPRIEIAIQGVGQLIEKLLPPIVARIPELITTVLPSLISAGTQMLNSLITGLSEAMPQLIDAAIQIIGVLGKAIIDIAPVLLEAGLQLILTLGQSLADNGATIVPIIVNLVMSMVNTIIDNLPAIIEVAIEIILALIDGILEALPQLINQMPQIIIKLATAIINSLPKIVDAGMKIITNLTNGLKSMIPNLISTIPTIVTGIRNVIVNTDWASIGKNIITGLKNGVVNMAHTLVDSVKSVVKNVVKTAKGLLGIHSPSRVFMEIGEYTSEGMAIGIEQNEDMVQKASENMVNTAIPDEIKVAETLNINRNAETSLINSLLSKLNNDKEIVLNIDGREFARATAEHMNNALNDYTNRYSFA